MTQNKAIKYFHGGQPGVREILPPSITGAPSSASYGAAGVCRTDKVYLTTNLDGAKIFAAMHPSNAGVIYEVEPRGELKHDPDYSGPQGECVECDSARVIRKIKFHPKERRLIRKAILKDFYK